MKRGPIKGFSQADKRVETKAMSDMRRRGLSWGQIASKFKCTRENIRQRVARYRRNYERNPNRQFGVI